RLGIAALGREPIVVRPRGSLLDRFHGAAGRRRGCYLRPASRPGSDSVGGFMRTQLVILALSAVSLYAQMPKLVPAPIELPKPGAEGTPPNFNVPNLEKLSTKARPPFLVPEGVTNVAKGKPVTSSEKSPLVGDLTMVTDGDTEQVEGNAVELGPGVQWVAI